MKIRELSRFREIINRLSKYRTDLTRCIIVHEDSLDWINVECDDIDLVDETYIKSNHGKTASSESGSYVGEWYSFWAADKIVLCFKYTYFFETVLKYNYFMFLKALEEFGKKLGKPDKDKEEVYAIVRARRDFNQLLMDLIDSQEGRKFKRLDGEQEVILDMISGGFVYFHDTRVLKYNVVTGENMSALDVLEFLLKYEIVP